jgi:hypothetical protein
MEWSTLSAVMLEIASRISQLRKFLVNKIPVGAGFVIDLRLEPLNLG